MAACGAKKEGAGTSAPKAAESTQSTAGKTLVLAMPDTPPGLDGDQLVSGYTEKIMSNVYVSNLVQFKQVDDQKFGVKRSDILAPGDQGIQPGLAEKYEVSPDGKVYTFYLRKDAKSQFGNAVTAEDVRWSFERRFALKGVGKFMTDVMGVEGPASVKVVNENTVQVTVKQPTPVYFKVDAMLFYGGVFDTKEVKKHVTSDDPWATKWLANNTAGFGPYYVSKFEKGRELVLKANPNYYGTKPAIETVIWKAVPSSANRLALLLKGDVDVAEELNSDELDKVDQSADAKVWRFPGNILFPLGLNTKQKPFDNKLVRQALAYAVPYDEINKTVFRGKAFPATSVVPDLYPGHIDAFQYKKDTAKAKELLTQAGYANGFDMTLTYDSAQPEHEQTAVILQTALREIGVKVTLEKLPTAVFSQKTGKKEAHSFLNIYWPFVADSGYALWIYLTSESFLNASNYNNPQFDDLVKKLLATQGDAARQPLAVDAQKLLADDVPWILLQNPGQRVAMRKNITGFSWNPGNHVNYSLLNKQ